MHTVKIILACWAAVCVLYVTFRCWQGGMFDTGLERLLGWEKARESDNWLAEELLIDLSAPEVGRD